MGNGREREKERERDSLHDWENSDLAKILLYTRKIQHDATKHVCVYA